ncbi:MAG: galactose-1-phosphate uridylyltransferase [Candidatus Omnitrophota bacterium]|jgi:UDPglucose--hexose-1-phosphate uridylyltransferase|nr:MAG: galactose-1-phosphate uridylyltransferase [Candidatus Omnitrophota bacterium]
MDNWQSQLRRDGHHGGWTLLTRQPEREQLLAMSPEQRPIHAPDILCDPEKYGASVIWRVTATLPDGGKRTVRVIANRFALYRVEGMEDREGEGMYDLMRGVGAHEIVIESENHEDSLATLSPHHYALTLQAYQDRISDLRKDFRLRSFSVFREWQCGTKEPSIHPHSQLIAAAIVPLGIKNELDAAREYYNYKERCLFCDMMRQELAEEERLVTATDEYMTYCPFASRYPFEVHLFPRRHSCDFCDTPKDQLPALAAMIRDTAYRLEQAIPDWRVLMVLHTTPVFDHRRKYYHSIAQDYHWHFEFLPLPPGFIDWYSRTGAFVEHTSPENAAAFLRDLAAPSPWT